jgi:hypothetical protein
VDIGIGKLDIGIGRSGYWLLAKIHKYRPKYWNISAKIPGIGHILAKMQISVSLADMFCNYILVSILAKIWGRNIYRYMLDPYRANPTSIMTNGIEYLPSALELVYLHLLFS